MNVADYLKIVSTEGRILHFECHGFWSTGVMKELGDQMWKQWVAAIDTFRGRPYVALVDVSRFKPGSDEGKDMVARMMKYNQDTGMVHAVEVVPSATLQLAQRSSAQKAGHSPFRTVVSSIDDAKRIVAEKVRELR